jgi:nucleoredoxin
MTTTTEATATPPFSIEALLGPKLLTKAGDKAKSTKTLMKGKDLVALYFSASWCPPCKTFSPVLAEFYKNCNQDSKFEVVYISSDKSVPEFDTYYGTMPWLAIPAEQGTAEVKNKLATTLGIQGIPSLIVVDVQTGEFVTAGAREDVTRVGGENPEEAKELVAFWKAMERKPLSEAKNNLDQGESPLLMKIVMFFAKNPMYVFGLLYFYKYLTRQWKSMYGEGAIGEDGDVPMMDQEAESEF